MQRDYEATRLELAENEAHIKQLLATQVNLFEALSKIADSTAHAHTFSLHPTVDFLYASLRPERFQPLPLRMVHA